jgi:UDP-N-acetylmuramate dehydrogenase
LTEEFRSGLKSLLRGELLFDEPMSLHTSLRTGGPADCFAIPEDIEDLRRLVAFLGKEGVPYLPTGGGFNLLVRDGGFRGVVISLEELNRLERTGTETIDAEAGVENGTLVRFTEEYGLGGLEFLVGIPGRLGGVLAMNAGAGRQSITDRLDTLSTLQSGAVITRKKKELEFGYRFLKLAAGEIILGASFRLEEENRAVIAKRISDFQEHRLKTQKVGFPNAGSFFRNPPDKPAWRLIDEAGLRGCRVGGAQVSEVHANFLVNRGGAKTADFIELATRIKSEVKKRTGINLEEEVKIVGSE